MTSTFNAAPPNSGSPWTCRATASFMPAYRDGALETTHSDQLFDHALACDHCFRVHWQPFQEESTAVMAMLLDSLEAEGQGEARLETVSGDHTVLTVSDWMSPVDLPLGAPTAYPNNLAPMHDVAPAPALQGPLLRQIGVLLPRVPKRSLIAGYSLYLGDGIPQPERTLHASAVLRVQSVDDKTLLSMEALREGVTVDNQPLAPFQMLPLQQAHLIELPGMLLYWQDLVASIEGMTGASGLVSSLTGAHKSRGERVGVGLLRFRGARFPLDQARLTVGRGDGCALRLPSREVRTNLQLDLEALEKTNDPKERERVSRLTLDAVEVSREHAALMRTHASGSSAPSYLVEALSDHPVYVWSQAHWKKLIKTQRSAPLQEGDELLIGLSLFQFCQG